MQKEKPLLDRVYGAVKRKIHAQRRRLPEGTGKAEIANLMQKVWEDEGNWNSPGDFKDGVERLVELLNKPRKQILLEPPSELLLEEPARAWGMIPLIYPTFYKKVCAVRSSAWGHTGPLVSSTERRYDTLANLNFWVKEQRHEEKQVFLSGGGIADDLPRLEYTAPTEPNTWSSSYYPGGLLEQLWYAANELHGLSLEFWTPAQAFTYLLTDLRPEPQLAFKMDTTDSRKIKFTLEFKHPFTEKALIKAYRSALSLHRLKAVALTKTHIALIDLVSRTQSEVDVRGKWQRRLELWNQWRTERPEWKLKEFIGPRAESELRTAYTRAVNRARWQPVKEK